MKIENLEISIKIGNKERKFTNLILNKYLDKFADNIIEFTDKIVPYCLVNFTNKNNITESSTNMLYDTILEAQFDKNVEILTDKSVINKYYYINEMVEELPLQEFKGQPIKELGFGNYNLDGEFELYAYLDISKYNIIIQENQPIIISRTDKITSDMNFYTNNQRIKGPIHLTNRGLLEIQGMEYIRVLPKLYSVGFGILPYLMTNEVLAENLKIKKIGTGKIQFDNLFTNNKENDLFPSKTLFPSQNLQPKKPTANLLIYKYKLYREVYENPELPPQLVDTGMYYTQYREVDKYGKVKLSVIYERSRKNEKNTI